MMSAVGIVFRKEMVDHLRDKRSIVVAMIYPLMGPLLLGLMFVFVGSSMRVGGAPTLIVPVVNFHNAPDLVRFLEKEGATIEPIAQGARSLVLGGWVPF